jgi:hypothetical protein
VHSEAMTSTRIPSLHRSGLERPGYSWDPAAARARQLKEE